MTVLATRILTAVLGIPIFLAAIYYSGIYLQIGLALLVFLGLYEFNRMYQGQGYWDYLIPAGLSLLLLAYTGVDHSFLLVWFVLQLMYLLIRATFTTRRPLSQMWQMAAVFYVAGLFSFLWLLNHEFGFIWSLFGILVTWATDTGAYFLGLAFGKTKLAPAISPKKTWEGSLGGIAAACAAAVILALVFEKSVFHLALTAVLLSTIGQTGDLVESAMKREREIKDSGKILPGHGGVLDRFDSLLFVLPVLYFILKYIPVFA